MQLVVRFLLSLANPKPLIDTGHKSELGKTLKIYFTKKTDNIIN